MEYEQQDQPINGIFSQKIIGAIGTGTTARKTEQYVYVYVREREDNVLEVQTLGPDRTPLGKKRSITREELLRGFLPEPQMSLDFAREQARAQQEITKAVARGDKFYTRGETYSAEFEYGKALTLDEENVRANFGIGLCFLARSEQDKAREVFQRLVRIEAAFTPEHKHLFNEFGIALRKNAMFDESLTYYSRALELSPGDENLHYNMARAAFGQGSAEEAARHLAQCLALNPRHPEALQFSAFLKRTARAGA